MRLAAAFFFRECPNAKVSEVTTERDMDFENYFLIAPKAHECFIVVRQGNVSEKGMLRMLKRMDGPNGVRG